MLDVVKQMCEWKCLKILFYSTFCLTCTEAPRHQCEKWNSYDPFSKSDTNCFSYDNYYYITN